MNCRIFQKNMECSYKNRSHWKNISKEKIRRHVFVVYVLNYPLSTDKFPLSFSFLHTCRFRWKNWFEKTALNMSIRRVIFTSGQNKPPFLPVFNRFQWFLFFTLEISFGSLPKPKNRNLKKIVDLKVYCNLKTTLVCGIKLILSINGFRTLIRGY